MPIHTILWNFFSISWAFISKKYLSQKNYTGINIFISNSTKKLKISYIKLVWRTLWNVLIYVFSDLFLNNWAVSICVSIAQCVKVLLLDMKVLRSNPDGSNFFSFVFEIKVWWMSLICVCHRFQRVNTCLIKFVGRKGKWQHVLLNYK